MNRRQIFDRFTAYGLYLPIHRLNQVLQDFRNGKFKPEQIGQYIEDNQRLKRHTEEIECPLGPIANGMERFRKPVASVSFTGDLVEEYPSLYAAAKALAKPASNIHAAIQRQGIAFGYYWKYIVNQYI